LKTLNINLYINNFIIIKTYINKNLYKLFINLKNKNIFIYRGLGIGDWGLGIGDWAQSPIPIDKLFFIKSKKY